MNKLVGTGVALVTPFKDDFSVDHDALKNIVNYNIDNDIDYLVVLGTTAESVTLSKQEKQDVINTIVTTNAKRLPLVIGIASNNTAEAVSLMQHTDLTDFDAVLSVSPYYNKPTQEGIYQHFKAISQVSPKPIILYNVPGRTSSNILPETAIRLANDFDNIVAIKEAAGDIVQAMELIKNKPEGFHIISGDDMIALPMTLAGGSGVISVIGEGLPKEFSTMINLGLEGKGKEAYKIHYKVMNSINLIFEEGNPAGIKTIFEELGLCKNIVRLPLVSASATLRNKIIKELNTFKS
ncbi:4-hydroxy-tetrahydrodipicolinate synthase [Flavobacteriaceae bacterium AU392]|nr:4-hydroxy-tetrahydrodipicolinate synthase [Flavobacteriaceae bacterium]RKM86108.1 4-hydroxy-tetrahydrodipicolinate synthase [Flavobacteriaceae bacterium AU392]